MKQLVFILLATVFLLSCKKESDIPAAVDEGYNYYPLETGKTNFYQVTEINIDVQSSVYDTNYYFLKTEIDTPYYDYNNKLIIPINRYTKNSISDQWVIKDVWFAYCRLSQLIVSEENIHFLKLVFPLAENKIWNGNSFNTSGEQEFEITDYAVPYTLNGLSYDSTVTVLERNDTSKITKYFRYEVYAAGTGLIELTDINISKSSFIFTLPIEQRIQIGSIYKQIRIEL
jgi:hypothetical protein